MLLRRSRVLRAFAPRMDSVAPRSKTTDSRIDELPKDRNRPLFRFGTSDGITVLTVPTTKMPRMFSKRVLDVEASLC